MKNKNLLITLATLLIAVAGVGWLLTSQASNTEAVIQQDRILPSPVVEEIANKTQSLESHIPIERLEELEEEAVQTDRRHGERHTYRYNEGGHCHDRWDD